MSAPIWAVASEGDDKKPLNADSREFWSAATGGEAKADPPTWAGPPPDTGALQRANEGGPDIKKQALILRVVNILTSMLLMITALIVFIGSVNASTAIISFYVWLFATLLCCFEVHVAAVANFILTRFGFMYKPLPRVVFVLLIAGLSFNLGLLGWISGGLLILSAGATTFLYCSYPEYRELQYKAAEATLQSNALAWARAHPDQAASMMGQAYRYSSNNGGASNV